MYRPKVSVVLPVYNAGEHLYRCLESLINQTLQDIEIIVILDCPTDNSEKVIEQYSKKDNRIYTIYNDKNIHIGHSRNKGIQKATGKYIAFCDHDDYLEFSMYEEMYNRAEQDKADLVCSPYVSIVDNEIKDILRYPLTIKSHELSNVLLQTVVGVISKDDIMKNFSFIGGVVWNKLFKLNVIKKNDIRYVDTRCFLGEDKLFLIEYLSKCNNASYIDKPLYFHKVEINNTGATFSYQAPENMVNYIHYLYQFLKSHNLFQSLVFRFYNNVQLLVFNTIQFSLKKGFFYCCRTIWRLKSDFIIREAFTNNKSVYMKRTTIKRKIGVAVISLLIKW